MRVLVAIPALNEQASITKVIAAVPRQLDGVDSISVLVIDDGSTDETAKYAIAAGAQVLRHRQNLGLGRAFQTAVRQALALRVDVLVTMDADGQFDPGDIPRLIGPILEGLADVTTASRFADPALIPSMPAIPENY